MNSIEVETIATVLRLTGGGLVRLEQPEGRRDGQLGSKALWKWTMFRHTSVRDLLRQISPFLTSKREAAEEVLREVPNA